MPAPDEEFSLRPDGTVQIVAVGRAYRLPRIRLGQYIYLREAGVELEGELVIADWICLAVEVLTGERPDPIPPWFADQFLPSRLVNHWRNQPLGPWLPAGSTGGTGAPRLTGVFAEVAPIYEALATRGIDEDRANQCTVFGIACMLGLHDPDRERSSGAPGNAGQRRRDPRIPTASDINRMRLEAAEKGLPPPKWGPEHAVDGDTAALMEALAK